MKFNFLSLIALLIVIAFGTSASAQTAREDAKITSPGQKEQTIKIKVSGITCSGDVKDIQTAVSKMEGVVSCKPVGKASANSVFEVSFNPALISEKEIKKAVESTPGCENPDDRPYKVKKA